MMLSKACLRAYRNMYPDGSIGYLEPGDFVGIESADGRSVVQPIDETDETFKERLSRCTAERNVFLEEWRDGKEAYPEADADY